MMRSLLAIALAGTLQFLSSHAHAAVAMVQTVFVAPSSSGLTFTTAAFPAIGTGNSVVGNWSFQKNGADTVTATVTDNAGTGNVYTYAIANWDIGGVGVGDAAIIAFWGTNITGNPTSITITLTDPNAPAWANNVMITEYSGASSISATVGPTIVDSANPSVSLTTTAANSMVYEFLANNDAATASAPTGFTLIENPGAGQFAANAIVASAGVVAPAWSSSGANENTLFALALAPSGAVTSRPKRSLLGVGR